MLNGYDVADISAGNMSRIGFIRIQVHIHQVVGMHADQNVAEGQLAGAFTVDSERYGILVAHSELQTPVQARSGCAAWRR